MFLTDTARAEILKTARESANSVADANLDTMQALADANLRDMQTAITDGLQALGEALRQEMKEARELAVKEALEQSEKKRADELKAKYDSDVPYVNILGEAFDKNGGVGLRLDWNKAFIEYLRANGFQGSSEEAIVDSWVSSLSNERITEATTKSGFE